MTRRNLNFQSTAPSGLMLLETELTLRPNPTLVCVDVFDTLLTRTLGEPQSIFLRLGETLRAEGRISLPASQFARARVAAEQRARRNVSPPADVTISQIYNEFLNAWPELSSIATLLIEAELEAENEHICLVPYAKQLLKLARNHSERIAFVSDMYLPTGFIRTQLIRYGLADANDPIYVSCDCGYTKSHGGALLRFVLQHQGVDGSSALHVGDNQRADYDAAVSAGMRAVLLKDTKLNRYECALENSACASGGLTSTFAGASRLTRLTHFKDEHPHAMLRVLAGVAGPLFVGFSIWLLGRAAASGLKRLYFLAREGEVLFEIASILNKRLDLGLDLRYLHVSRISINLAVLTEPSPVNLDWALTHARTHSLRGILQRIGLDPEDLAPALLEIELPQERWNTKLTIKEYDALLERLRSESAQMKLTRRAAAARHVVESYLAENDFFDDYHVGLVDTTGTGSQMRTLHQLRRANTQAKTSGFLFFRTWKPHLREVDFPTIHTYLADDKNKVGQTNLQGLVQMLEVFASTDYGTVVGYESLECGIRPKFAERNAMVQNFCSVRALRKPLHTFAKELPLGPQILREYNDARPGIVAAFSLFWDEPTPDEAVYWGSFPFEIGAGLETDYHQLAPPLRITDVVRKVLGRRLPQVAWYTWSSAREHKSPAVVRFLLQSLRFAKRRIPRGWRTRIAR